MLGVSGMIVREVHLYHVRMPLLEPWVTAYGSQDGIESLFVNLKFESGDGWGECAPAPLPLYNSEYTKGAFAAAHDVFAPQIVGKEISSADQLQSLFQEFKGHEFTRSAFDSAWWDAHARACAKPLWSLVGGVNQTISVGADIPVLASTSALLNRVSEAIDQGYPRVKLKFNRSCTVAMIEQVRTTYPDLVMHIDCNSGFTLDDIEMFRAIDRLELKMIEQPLAYDDLVDHAALQKQITTPICLDESITSLSRAAKAIRIKACRWINIKISRVGGLTNALAIHDFCKDQGVPVWVGGMLESAVGQSPSLALATKDNVVYPSDIFPSRRFFDKDFSTPEITLSEKGKIAAPARPGSGFTPKLDLLHKHSIGKARIK
jgi:O-succinylbenzoate synthase